EKLGDAYTEGVAYFEVSQRSERKEEMPLAAGRAMRGYFMRMRLALIGFAGEYDPICGALYRLFSVTLTHHRATSPVRLFPLGLHTTTPRRELVSAVMLEAASPQTLAPRQIELTSRISAHLASAFSFSDGPSDHVYLCVDLAKSAPPQLVTKG